MSSSAGRLQELRKLYVKAHQQLQEAGSERLRLQDRIRALEEENAALRARLPYSHGASNAN